MPLGRENDYNTFPPENVFLHVARAAISPPKDFGHNHPLIEVRTFDRSGTWNVQLLHPKLANDVVANAAREYSEQKIAAKVRLSEIVVRGFQLSSRTALCAARRKPPSSR